MKKKAKEKAADEGKAPRRRCQDERAKTMMMMMRMGNRGQRGRESGRQLCVVVAQIEVNCI